MREPLDHDAPIGLTAADLPAFTADPVDRLRHTLAVAAGQPDGEWAILATYNLIAPNAETGITYGDLRLLLATLDAR